ncbi:hypothetical protein [Bradyrhizobium niftali]
MIFGPRSETLDPRQLPLFAITAEAAGAVANDERYLRPVG